MSRQAIVAANWKMNGSLALIEQMVVGLSNVELADNVDIVVCPSFPYLASFKDALAKASPNHVYLGAQNVSEFEKGAFTGEVSTQMLKDLSTQYVILGHSERRSIYNESSEQVALKVEATLNADLLPILCIGESEEQRSRGETEQVLAAQIQPVVNQVGIEKFENVVIAYEPVWAIGTGKTASPEMAQETHQFIRKFLAKLSEDVSQKVPLLYGGSVNATNCDELFAQTDIDGGLIGGASLKVDEFKTICLAAKGTR